MALISQTDLDPGGESWHAQVLRDLSGRLTPPSGFPCTFAQSAFRRELLWFSFVEDLSAAGLAGCRADLAAYIDDCRGWDGEVNRARPLVIALSRRAALADRPEGYHAIGWRILQDWLDHDPAPWPETVATKPEQPFWSLCYEGMQLFVNMSCPAHRRRKSRNLGAHFLLVVNPRERFDIVAGDTPEGNRVRAAIRARSDAYDALPHAPQLGSYQKGEIEWVQYALGEDNAPPAGRCPLIARR